MFLGKSDTARHNVNDDQIYLTKGGPDDVIEGIAKEIEADLVVIGSVARESLSGILLGNTAERILIEYLPMYW